MTSFALFLCSLTIYAVRSRSFNPDWQCWVAPAVKSIFTDKLVPRGQHNTLKTRFVRSSSTVLGVLKKYQKTEQHIPSWHLCHHARWKKTTEKAVSEPRRMTLSYSQHGSIADAENGLQSVYDTDKQHGHNRDKAKSAFANANLHKLHAAQHFLYL